MYDNLYIISTYGYAVALPIFDPLSIMCVSEVGTFSCECFRGFKLNSKENKATCERTTKLDVKVMSTYPTTRHDIILIYHACSDDRDTILLCLLMLTTCQTDKKPISYTEAIHVTCLLPLLIHLTNGLCMHQQT